MISFAINIQFFMLMLLHYCIACLCPLKTFLCSRDAAFESVSAVLRIFNLQQTETQFGFWMKICQRVLEFVTQTLSN